MERFMKAETLISDKNFVKSLMTRVPNMFFANFNSDEIKSEVYLAIYKAAPIFNPQKGRMVNFVYSILINQLNNKLRENIEIRQNEVPLEAAYSKTYMGEQDSHTELLAYFRTLPSEWLSDLTEFVLGKKKKEEIAISNDPSFERVLNKIDSLIA